MGYSLGKPRHGPLLPLFSLAFLTHGNCVSWEEPLCDCK